MKKALALLLTCALLLSLTACGGKTPPAESVAASESTQAVETTEVITEPTLSPEEMLIASLPEKVRQAYDLGLVDLELLEDLDRICLGAEAAQIIQTIHVRHHGVESKIMNQIFESNHAGIEVTRYWLAQTMHMAEAEYLVEAPSDDYIENLKYMLTSQDVWNASFGYFYSGDGAIMVYDEEQNAYIGDPWALPRDWDEMCDNPQGELFIDHPYDGSNLAFWVLSAYDRLTGEKIMTCPPDESFLPRMTMTVREVVETTLRYNNWIPPEQVLLPYEELPTYDTTIITDELLSRETTLPDASCQKLPESWRGISSKALNGGNGEFEMADCMLQENEIQIIKDAGFNFLRLYLDFKYYSSDALGSWPGWATDPKLGYMNETRLKEIDQIIAWCMERDIHVNLVADGFVGWNPSYPPPFDKEHQGRNLGKQWAVLARRYADIPNTYLSFTLHDEPHIWLPKQYGNFFVPVAKAIQEVSPDRCIIADIGGRGDPGDAVAALGVALSTKVYWPDAFHMDDDMETEERAAFFASATWPYVEGDSVYDAEAAMVKKRWNCETPDKVAAVAKENGVGFMISGWAPTIDFSVRERFSDETMENYLNDFVQVLSDRGYGWCYGDSNGFTGLFNAYPMEGTINTQVENYPLFIHEDMMNWFQILNGVK